MDYTALGQRIRTQRTALKLTQRDLAERTNTSTSFIGHVERGTRKASLETLIQIANALAMHTDELLQDSLQSFIPIKNISDAERAFLAAVLQALRSYSSRR